MNRRNLGARIVLASGAVLLSGGFMALERTLVPDAEVIDPHWQRAGSGGPEGRDYAAWDAFLRGYGQPDSAGLNRSCPLAWYS